MIRRIEISAVVLFHVIGATYILWRLVMYVLGQLWQAEFDFRYFCCQMLEIRESLGVIGGIYLGS